MPCHYTVKLLELIEPHDRFRIDQGGVTHVAWQVGDLAMAEYRLALEPIRGQRVDEEALISEEFLSCFGRTVRAGSKFLHTIRLCRDSRRL